MNSRFPDEVRRRVQTPYKRGEFVIGPSYVPGEFNSHAVDCPFVFVKDGKAGMTFVGWDGVGYQTGISWLHSDGSWGEQALIFGRDPSSRYRRYNSALTSILRDNDLTGSGELLKIDGYYYGTYHSYPSAGYENGSAVIGVVRSKDLYEWEEYGDVLRPEDGSPWERGGLYKSWLLKHDDKYWIFYNAKDLPRGSWREQTGAVVSTDFTHWERVADHPLIVNGPEGSMDERFASDPCIMKYGDYWILFYFGLATDGHARETYAVSKDLISWTKSGELLVDVGPEGAIDSQHAHKPTVIYRDRRLEHYYCAVSAMQPVDIAGYAQRERRGISVAVSDRDDE